MYAQRVLGFPELRLFLTLALQADGFHPATKWIVEHANISANKLSDYKKMLEKKGFIEYEHCSVDGKEGFIKICWENITQQAKDYFSIAYSNIPPEGDSTITSQGHITDNITDNDAGYDNSLFNPTIKQKYKYELRRIKPESKQAKKRSDIYANFSEASLYQMVDTFPEKSIS